MSFATQKALQVLNDFWDGQLPVDVEKIAAKLGVTVLKRHEQGAITPPEGIEPHPRDGYYDISGRFDYVNGKPYATIRTTDAPVRQRFTLAHELGHYILGHPGGFRDNAAAVANFTNYDPSEVAANAFAAELLMPKLIVDYLVGEEKIFSVRELAARFHVSEIAMTWRLRNLGWLDV